MLPTEDYRRPWVLHDSRTPNVVPPARIIKSPEEQRSWWRDAKRRIHESMIGDLVFMVAVGVCILAFIVALFRQ